MRPIYLTYSPVTASTVTSPIVLDQYISPGNMVTTIVLGGSATSATVVLEYTTDNVIDPTVTSYTWQPFTATPFSATGTYAFTAAGAVEGAFTMLPKAVRVRCTAVAGTSPTMSVQVIQAGIGGT